MSLQVPNIGPLAPPSVEPLPHAQPLTDRANAPPATDALIRALSAGGRLHPKQKLVLQCLNRHRAPLHPDCTTTISHALLHRETGVSLDHIRKNVLKDLLFTGLIAVASRTLAGTIFRFTYEADIIDAITAECAVSLEPQPLTWTKLASAHPAPTTLDHELQQTQQILSEMTELLRARQEVKRLRFLAALTDQQMHWLTEQAKRRVDGQEGMRFIGDRFPHYQDAEQALIEEWLKRSTYGESVPVMATPQTPITTTARSPIIPQSP